MTAASSGFEKADPLSDPTSGQGANSRAGLSDYPRRVEFAESANDALATKPQSGVDSAYRGKEARQRANAPGRDTEGDASMPDKTTTRFKRVQAGQYATEDGRYLIEQQEIERECDCLACQSGSPDCPHDGIALDWFWHIWDTETNNYAEGTHFSSFETLREAKEWFV